VQRRAPQVRARGPPRGARRGRPPRPGRLERRGRGQERRHHHHRGREPGGVQVGERGHVGGAREPPPDPPRDGRPGLERRPRRPRPRGVGGAGPRGRVPDRRGHVSDPRPLLLPAPPPAPAAAGAGARSVVPRARRRPRARSLLLDGARALAERRIRREPRRPPPRVVHRGCGVLDPDPGLFAGARALPIGSPRASA
jgi:hypothetical protein